MKVGDYIVDFEKNVIYAPDLTETLCTEKLLSLLALFIIKDGGVVTREDAFEIVYKGQHVVESSFRHRVKDLRQIFADTPPYEYIENIKGKGYYLKADVSEIKHEDLFYDPEQYTNKKTFRLTLIVAILLSVFATSLILYYNMDKLVEPPVTGENSLKELTPLTYSKGHEFYKAPSPNGKYLIYSYKPVGKKNWTLKLLDLENNHTTNLTDSAASDTRPRWSADGKFITFSRRDDNKCQFIKASFNSETKNIEAFEDIIGCEHNSPAGYSHLWKNNRSVLYSNAKSFSDPIRIYSYSFETAQGWPVTSPPPDGRGDYYYSLSYDEKQLVVLRNRFWYETEIWLYKTDTWEGKLLDTVAIPLYTISWTLDNNSLVYKTEKNEIIERNIQTGESSVVAKLSLPFRAPILSGQDKEDISVTIGVMTDSDISRVSIDTGEVEVVESSSFREVWPIVSGDNEYLAWVSDRSGVNQLWVKKIGGRAKQITHLNVYKSFDAISFSPGGTRLVGAAGGDWFIVSQNFEDVQFYTLEEGRVASVHWVDEQTLIIVKIIDSNKIATQMDLVSGNEQTLEISNVNVVLPGFKPGEFFYVKSNETGIWYYSGKKEQNEEQEDKGQLLVETDSKIYNSHNWTLSEKGIYFVQFINNKSVLKLYDFSSKSVLDVFPGLEAGAISVDKKNQWLYYVDKVEGNLDSYLIKR
ncbi:winged helix-turn-helix domain-containing protein [Pleionea sp. CnH1-48]|uniref:winged helix-turn-helix domain-containing protein n=1 Tax=Pleionea sp. CnH1-48 TaxID=2954494 RepID=UPI002096901D|nr:winged helix-turn-helix domain-containing protein [Pleionea sp. CnH1-48]MCO7222781.1 winged helix-turn-helix domain-containing protein [Pleionea sp. CnH1-48]